MYYKLKFNILYFIFKALPSQKGDRGEPGQSILVGDDGDYGKKGEKGELGDSGYDLTKT